MSEAQHTPAPWENAEPRHPGGRQEEDRLIYAVSDGNWLHIAKVYQYQNDDNCDANGTALANACLISAAPELLQALKNLLNAEVFAEGEGIYRIANTDVDGSAEAVKLARAAIAKATLPKPEPTTEPH